MTVVPIAVGRDTVVRLAINARADYLKASDALRLRWVEKAIRMLGEGASTGWAISHCVREMTSEHLSKARE